MSWVNSRNTGHTCSGFSKSATVVIPCPMESDINLIAFKVDTLIAQGYQLRKQEHRNDFLKYNRKM